MMVGHTRLTMQLKMAAPHVVTVPKDKSDESVNNALKPLKGREADEIYIRKIGVEGHQKAVGACQK